MKNTGYLKQTVCGMMVLLSGIYLYLNQAKLDVFVSQYYGIVLGAAAPTAQIKFDGKTVWEKPLLSTGFFDASGKLQVHYITLKAALMQQLMQQDKDIKVYFGDDSPVKPQFANQLQVVRADFPHHRIYFTSAGRIDGLATVVLSETRGGQHIVECLPQSLCQSVNVSSQEWGRVEGPYLRTDVSPTRMGLPRGRWLVAPGTSFTVHADSPRHIAMLINLYALMPDQQITVSGPAIRHIKQPEVAKNLMKIGMWDLYPRSYILDMDLQAGDNQIRLEYSRWPEPLSEGGILLAAYLSAIKIKALN